MKQKRKLSKLMVLLIALSMMFAAIPTWAAETDTREAKPKLESRSEVWVNPLYPQYEDELREYLAKKESQSRTDVKKLKTSGDSAVQIFSDIDSATNYVRSQMVDRKTTIEYGWIMETPSQEVFDQILADAKNKVIPKAFIHTKEPDEGDYISYQISGSEVRNGYFTDENTGKMVAKIIFTPQFFTTKDEENTIDLKVNTVLNSLNLNGKTNYKKMDAIYKWMCDNITYAYKQDGVTPSDEPHAHAAYGAIVDHNCVCQGYACLLYRLALEEGIDARIVSGNDPSQGGHAWNAIQMGQKWYLCDATWDASFMQGGTPKYTFFLKGTTDFLAKGEYGHGSFVWHTEGNEDREDVLTTYKSLLDTADYVDKDCTHTNVESVVAKEATCAEKGYKSGYYKCDECGVYFSKNASGEYVPAETSSVEIAALGHSLKAINAKKPTCFVTGNSAYWQCQTCKNYFSDDKALKGIEKNSWVLPKLKAKVTLSKKSAKIKKGKTTSFKIKLVSGDSIKSITSSKKKIAKILSGKKLTVKVKGLKKGTAYVNIKTKANASAKFKVVVK